LQEPAPLKGVSARELPRVPLHGVAFALVRDATQVCGGEVTSTKLCLRKCGSRECTNHAPGHPLVTDNTLYVHSATSGTALTTVFRGPTLSITGLEKELIEYIIKANDGEGALSAWSLFSWLQENNIKTTEAFTEDVEIHENVRALPLKTPAKPRIEKDMALELWRMS